MAVLDMARESDSESSAFFADGDAAGLSWRGAEKITSTLTGTRKELRALCSKYAVPDAYTSYSAREKPACAAADDNAVSVHVDSFDAGLRLPLHGFYVKLLRHYGLAPSQLVPNAWRYMAAFVLLCADAGLEPLLPVFRKAFTVLTDTGESKGLHDFRPYRTKAQAPLFTRWIPVYKPSWKSRFFFLQSLATSPWPCPMKWGKPTRAAIGKPRLTAVEKTALQKLLDRAAAVAGKYGIVVVPFLSDRTLPVGSNIPLPAVHKQEAATAIARTIELPRKRKSPESSIPPPQQSQSGVGTSTPLGSAAHARHSNDVSVGDRSTTLGLVDSVVGALEQAKMAVEKLEEKEQELEASKDDEIAQLKLELQVARDGPARLGEELRLAREALEKANAARSAEVGRLAEELRLAKEALDKAKAEIQAVKVECQNMLLRCQQSINSELRNPLLFGDQLAAGGVPEHARQVSAEYQ